MTNNTTTVVPEKNDINLTPMNVSPDANTPVAQELNDTISPLLNAPGNTQNTRFSRNSTPGSTCRNRIVVSPTPDGKTMTQCELNLKFWHSGQCDKKHFEILKNGDNYIPWYHIFSAEIDAQHLSRAIDPKFNSDTLTDHHDKLMWHAQQVYFWNVLLYVCQGDISKDAVNNIFVFNNI